MKNNISQFNLVISGVGGQGLITLLRVLGQAASEEGREVRTSELHGLSQRAGSVEVHLRFGEKIYSPLVKAGGADLIISLELNEALTACRYAKERKTVFLINNFFQPIGGQSVVKAEKFLSVIKKFSAKVLIVSASDICLKNLGTEVVIGIYLLGYAIKNGLIPLKPASIISALKKVMPKDYLTINLKAFNLPRSEP